MCDTKIHASHAIICFLVQPNSASYIHILADYLREIKMSYNFRIRTTFFSSFYSAVVPNVCHFIKCLWVHDAQHAIFTVSLCIQSLRIFLFIYCSWSTRNPSLSLSLWITQFEQKLVPANLFICTFDSQMHEWKKKTKSTQQWYRHHHFKSFPNKL